MNYKEALFFIAKSLTISLEEKSRKDIEFILKTTNIDWDMVVKVSTNHFIFPALYCNFKRADFLKYLPAELNKEKKNSTKKRKTIKKKKTKKKKRKTRKKKKKGLLKRLGF